ncbi:type II secretion system protein [Sporosarcina sp. Te-1]|uniref:type II secretion system protein n=1 Tax=Sporosarcina sp. Te-1 TaxID=2818390 RepID=UPI001A9CBF5B|nr:type II secretion system protein [Sporosarcina sp. Te-1]QTD41569.1 type II secretion system protein [Sporosarcina sp. Te-1]
MKSPFTFNKDQRGMTLVELLAVLVISSLVAMLIWTAVMLVLKYNISETKKLQLQQEANYIISEIQNVHRYCDNYSLTIQSNQVSINDCNTNSNRIISNDYIYTGTSFDDKQIDAKTKDAAYKIDLLIRDPDNRRIQVEVSTVITRYKSN